MASFGDAIRELEAGNVGTAIGILELFVQQGNNSHVAQAAYKLGEIYHKGLGGHKDDVLAARWYFVAAKRHYGEAQYMLGELFLDGTGVPKNPCQAHKWYNLAVMNGYDALRKRDTLANMIAPERLAQAEDLAWDFVEELYQDNPTNN